MKIEEYRKLSKIELGKELNLLKIESMKAGVGLLRAKVGKKREKGETGSDIKKRIRKEIARINNVLNELKKLPKNKENGK